MKTIKQNFLKWYFCLPLALLLIVTSCTKNVDNSTPAKKENVSNYSGQDLFNAIFFGKGAAANSISSYTIDLAAYATTDDDKLGINKVEDDIITNIKKSDPTFFDNFKMKVTSGIPSNVNEVLSDAGQKILSSLRPGYSVDLSSPKFSNIKNEFEKDGGNHMTKKQAISLVQSDKYKNMFASTIGLKADANNIQPNSAPCVSVSTLVLFYAYVAIAGAAVLVLVVPAITPSSSGDQLQHEQMVGAVTTAYEIH